MRTRWLPCLPLLALFALPSPIPAQGQGEKPTLVLRVRSLETLLGSGQLLLEAVGKGDVLKQIDDLIKSKVGPKGLAGVDAKRPLGAYASIGKDITDLKAVLVVPISNEKDFLQLLDGLNFKAEKDKDGLYTVKQDVLPVNIHFRFAHKYAYVTALNPEAIATSSLIEPGRLFSARQKVALSLTLRVDQVPDMAKQIILQHLNDELDKVLEAKDKGVSAAQDVFRSALVREIGRQVTAAIRDGTELNVELDVNPKTNALTVDLTLGAKPGSTLASTIEKLGEAKSLFAGLLRDDAAMNALVCYGLPDKLRAGLTGLIKEAASKSLAETTDEAKRVHVRRMMDALEPTFKAGDLDLAISLRGPGPGGCYTLVGGVKLKEGEKLAKTLLDLIKTLPDTERGKIKLDKAKVGDTSIHELDLSKGFDAKTRELFSAEPVYVAFRPEAAYFALGEDGFKAIKEALAAPPKATAPMRLELSLARLAKVMARTPEQQKAARLLETKGEEGRFRISIEGGERLRLRVDVNLAVVRLLAQLGALEPTKKE
jgi:hypothetical protein